MALGPGKYDDLATYVREQSEAGELMNTLTGELQALCADQPLGLVAGAIHGLVCRCSGLRAHMTLWPAHLRPYTQAERDVFTDRLDQKTFELRGRELERAVGQRCVGLTYAVVGPALEALVCERGDAFRELLALLDGLCEQERARPVVAVLQVGR